MKGAPAAIEAKTGTRERAREIYSRALTLLREGKTPRAAMVELAEQYQIGFRRAARHVDAVLVVLQADDEREPDATVKTRILARYEHLCELALARTRTVTYWVSKDAQEHEEVPDPDVTAAGKMLGAIAMIRGVVPTSSRELPGPSPAPRLPARAQAVGETVVVEQPEAVE